MTMSVRGAEAGEAVFVEHLLFMCDATLVSLWIYSCRLLLCAPKQQRPLITALPALLLVAVPYSLRELANWLTRPHIADWYPRLFCDCLWTLTPYLRLHSICPVVVLVDPKSRTIFTVHPVRRWVGALAAAQQQ
jgi:hypothetical protein